MRLVIVKGLNRGKEYSLEEGSNLLGRWDPDTGAFPEIDLEPEDDEAKVSRKHAIIRLKDGRLSIEDCGSLNGTFINRGPKLEQGQLHALHPGDEIIIGKIFLRVETEEPDA
ncbi:MAG: FHA domain-containing protein [Bdellovibrionales bacterium]|nr:FHA domain-containing protein [Bdellovibrionales bacterium]